MPALATPALACRSDTPAVRLAASPSPSSASLAIASPPPRSVASHSPALPANLHTHVFVSAPHAPRPTMPTPVRPRLPPNTPHIPPSPYPSPSPLPSRARPTVVPRRCRRPARARPPWASAPEPACAASSSCPDPGWGLVPFCIKIYLIACRRCGPFSHSNHSSWLVVVVGFRHAIMQIYTAPLAIPLAIYIPVACRQRRRHSQLYVRCLSS